MELIPVLAEWHQQQWKNSGPDRERLILSRVGDSGIPKTFIALHNGELAGFVCLIEHNAPTRPDLTPWLVSLFVHPRFRGCGIGSALVEHCTLYATALGFKKLHLYTSSAVLFYKNLGWNSVDTFELAEKTEVILSKNC